MHQAWQPPHSKFMEMVLRSRSLRRISRADGTFGATGFGVRVSSCVTIIFFFFKWKPSGEKFKPLTALNLSPRQDFHLSFECEVTSFSLLSEQQSPAVCIGTLQCLCFLFSCCDGVISQNSHTLRQKYWLTKQGCTLYIKYVYLYANASGERLNIS